MVDLNEVQCYKQHLCPHLNPESSLEIHSHTPIYLPNVFVIRGPALTEAVHEVEIHCLTLCSLNDISHPNTWHISNLLFVLIPLSHVPTESFSPPAQF